MVTISSCHVQAISYKKLDNFRAIILIGKGIGVHVLQFIILVLKLVAHSSVYL